jgi:cell division protein FtsL
MIKIIEFGVNKFILETRDQQKWACTTEKKVDRDKILNFSLIWKMMCVFLCNMIFFIIINVCVQSVWEYLN